MSAAAVFCRRCFGLRLTHNEPCTCIANCGDEQCGAPVVAALGKEDQ